MKTIKISLVLAALCLYGIFTASVVFASVSDDQVTSQKIREADGTSGQDTNTGSGVKTGHIQDGAITDAKIIGPVSSSKIEKPANVIIVAKSGGDFTSIQVAIDSINPTAENPYVVKVMPGTYVGMVRMKSYVALEGAGPDVTTIQASNAQHAIYLNNVTGISISGFTVTGATGGSSGIMIYLSSSVTVTNNIIRENLYGISAICIASA